MNDVENKEMADLLFPDIDSSIDEYPVRFPKRILPIDAKVTRFGPSPTGFLHIGGARTALFSYLFARHFAYFFYRSI